MAVNLPIFFGELLVGGFLMYAGSRDVAAALGTSSGSSSGSPSSTGGVGTLAPDGKLPPLTGSAQESWARSVIAGLGGTPTKAKIDALVAWQGAEGGPADNPLNTTLGQGGAQGSAIQGYGSVGAGVTATINTLKGGNYGPLVALLRAPAASANAIKAAVIASPWDGSGHYVGTTYGSNPDGAVG